MKFVLLITIFLLCIMNSYAKIHTELIDYKDGDVQLQGYLAYDDSNQDKRPGIIVVHEWWGLNDYAKNRAEELASLGYVAFAADMYGKGVLAKTPDEAGKLAGGIRGNPGLMRRRANASLDILKKNKFVNADNIAAIGYCFGGSVVLELAKSGADIDGVVSFHGGFSPQTNSEELKDIKSNVLILHGAQDRIDNVLSFTKALENANKDWQLVVYSGAVHTFTNPAAGNDPSKGSAYNETAAKRSWEEMQIFFNDIFSKGK